MSKKIKIVICMMIILIIGLGAKFVYGEAEDPMHKNFKDHVVFYPQHQDDETLWGSSAIIEAIRECGADNVYVVLVSDGSGVNVFNQLEQFKGISRKEKEILRNNEFKAALNSLGVKNSNIRILADETEKTGTHYDLMEKTILDFENKFGSVTQVSQHYKYDNHPMHRKNGVVLKRLSDEGKVKDARYFVKPAYVKDIPEDQRDIYTANNEEDKAKVKGALDAYKTKNEKEQLYGIGYMSTHKYFDHLYNDPQYTSVLSRY
ncbi:MAG: PIG-L family deacetylase [Paraclostridium bifermentans]|uniref:PIG-L family deacetylase n=1 Tax=Paraclostridium bifermentans TaxID=1490 RepID=UPI0011DE1A30|nr:PIG-L family deacetylase [Paraclostridium bifermentans]MBS5952343.1 PIG-L family deacetylase [Paraclostridium bifermentans]MBS6507423.1 PIG-L family deacetylase [Paraclostridium bifermentans]MBU5287737.1 PIG-L family deacetylase [Paraclostridium bifermentans]MDU3801633.1 PIG-L family deacetylase [Paraclostridium bifermentans]